MILTCKTQKKSQQKIYSNSTLLLVGIRLFQTALVLHHIQKKGHLEGQVTCATALHCITTDIHILGKRQRPAFAILQLLLLTGWRKKKKSIYFQYSAVALVKT